MELILENIKKRYGKQYALACVDCKLQEGIYGILGPNGAGKTTLLSIITGIVQQSEGEIRLDGRNIHEQGTEFLDRIGYSPQYPMFYKNFTVIDFLKYMGALKSIPKKEIGSRCDEVLELVNLSDAKKKQIGALSGGMRQRLSIAQAVLNNPDIIIFDEPTAGLDPGERIRFRNIVSKISQGKMVLITTHIVSDIEYIADEVLIMKEGKLVKKNSVEALLTEMEGFVWETLCPAEELSRLTEDFLISSIRHEGNKIALRIICNNCPYPGSVLQKPKLEDVFLNVFGKLEDS